jgi:hypothetical protein
MPGATQKHNHFWLWGYGAGVGFMLAAALLVWKLLNDWARLVAR